MYVQSDICKFNNCLHLYMYKANKPGIHNIHLSIINLSIWPFIFFNLFVRLDFVLSRNINVILSNMFTTKYLMSDHWLKSLQAVHQADSLSVTLLGFFPTVTLSACLPASQPPKAIIALICECFSGGSNKFSN